VSYRPRLILAGLSGGSGKTTITLGVARAWVRHGRKVKPYKKGPDYIDAVWLGLAARATAANLDPFLMSSATLRNLFFATASPDDLALVEGNRGLFDGKDVDGSCSTAHLARTLDAPVVLVMDCTKMTRTAAAVVGGIQKFEPELNLAGVVCNRTAGERHRAILRRAIEHYTDVPVLGCLPKIDPDPIPERHMGLVSHREHHGADAILDQLADVAGQWIDLDRLLAVAETPTPGHTPDTPAATAASDLWPAAIPGEPVRIGYVRDAALWFYYEENLDALRAAGAELVELSVLDTAPWPELHGLYLGGGFPETQAADIAANHGVLDHIRTLARTGAPIYAECGGFMFLGENLTVGDVTYPMAGVLPVSTTLCAKPQGLGYTEARVTRENPFFAKDSLLRGHEFHYSRCIAAPDAVTLPMALHMERGTGMLDHDDGLLLDNTFAAYNHIHALSTPQWAPNFIAAARAYRARRR
jgi:cobyrinic acid a,c-diamide synthase